jgi:hypothetical protein
VRLTALVATIALLWAGPAAAQSLFWAGYGHNADHATGLETGQNVTLGYILARPAAGFAGVVGVPVDADVGSRWATATGWFDQRLGATSLWLNGTATLFAFDTRLVEGASLGSVASLDAHTALDLGPVEARARLGGRHGSHFAGGESYDRLLGRAGASLGTRAASIGAGLATVELRGDLDHWRAQEDGYNQLGVRAGLAGRRVLAWASASRWLHADLAGTGWDVGARLSVSDRVSVTARGGVQAEDILFWIPPQRTWLLGVQLRTGADPRVATLPVPVLHSGRNAVTLALPVDPFATAPAVAGTFSDWQPIPMRRSGDRWQVSLDLQPGVYEYSFVTADGTWFVPEGTPGRKPDGFGGHVAVVIVQ